MKKIYKNNKGFTLVELIVVIAVLAVITIVATPKLIEYVEKARKGTDENAIWEVAHAAEVAYHEDGNKTADNVMVVRVDPNGSAAYGSGGKTENNTSATESTDFLHQRVNEIVAEDSYKYKSIAYRAHTFTITVDEYGKATVDGLGDNKIDWTQDELGITAIVDFFANDVADALMDAFGVPDWMQGWLKDQYIDKAKQQVQNDIQEVLDSVTDEQWETFNQAVFEMESAGKSWESLGPEGQLEMMEDFFGDIL